MGKWLQSNEHLTFEVRERVARITLNRPDRRNALSWEMLSELRAALLEADDLRSVSVIVLGGAGPDFCAGYDMKSAYARYAAERAMGSPPNHMWIYNVGPQWAKRLLFSGATLRSHNPLQRSLERAATAAARLLAALPSSAQHAEFARIDDLPAFHLPHPQRAIEGTDLAADQRIERARLRRVERTCCRECCGG
jgi:hypothetical protein